MKKILLLTLTAFIALSSHSLVAQESNLSVFSEDGHQFFLILNGIRQNDAPETNVRVEGLTQPHYSAKIIFKDESLGEVEKKFLQTQDVDGNNADVTYKIKTDKKGALKLKYFSSVPMEQAPPPPANVTVVQYNTQPKPAISTISYTETTTTTTSGGGSSTSDNVNVGISVGGVDFGMDVSVSDGGGYSEGSSTYSSTTTTTTTSSTSGGGTYYEEPVGYSMPGYSGKVGCADSPMSNGDFASAKESISDKSFSDGKLTTAKQIARNNCLTAQQVKEITEIFDFEDKKLEFAKFAYDYTHDLGNYYKVNDVFDFESSIEELDSHIGGR